MEHKDIKRELSEKLEANYISFMRKWMELEPIQLIDSAEEIAATKLVYNELKDGGFSVDYFEYLLRFKNPLEVVRDKWIEETSLEMVHDDELTHALWLITDHKDAEQDYEMDEDFLPPEQEVRMC